MKLQKLAHKIERRFSVSELRDLFFRLDINYDDLPGATRKDKVRELVGFCERHNRLNELVHLCKELRPKESWDSDQPSPSNNLPSHRPQETGEPTQNSLSNIIMFAGFGAGLLTLLFIFAIIFAQIPVNQSNKPLLVSGLAMGSALAIGFLGGSAAFKGKITIPIIGANPLTIGGSGGFATFIIVFFVASLMIDPSDVLPEYCLRIFVNDALATENESTELLIGNGISGTFAGAGKYCFQNVPNLGRTTIQVTSSEFAEVCTVNNIPTSLGVHDVACSVNKETPDTIDTPLSATTQEPTLVDEVPIQEPTLFPTSTNTTVEIIKPDQFIVEYYDAINNRQYELTWSMLTPNFIREVPKNFEAYTQWWNTVDRVETREITILNQDSTSATVSVLLRYYMKNGTTEDSPNTFTLIVDTLTMSWLFDGQDF